MEYKKPNNINTIGLLGYLVVINKQIHNYQVNVIKDYLNSFGCEIEDTPLRDIFADSDSKLLLDDAIEAFKGEESEIQANILFLLYMLALVDNAIDSGEEAFIDRIADNSALEDEKVKTIKVAAIKEASTFRDINNVLFNRIKPHIEKKWYEKIIEWIIGFFRMLFGIKDNSYEEEKKEYIAAIQKCCQIAHEDFESIKPSYSIVSGICEDAVHDIKVFNNSLPRDTDVAEEVSRAINAYCDKLKFITSEQERIAKDSFEQKERTLSDFTISLLGRTKAGKSTLHSILTNQGRAYIGEGKQRTTRFNRVFQWNLMRIIDTPGIGSPEAEGRSDDEIANSVLGESDIICFVIADDAISRDILEFIERIASLNKPIAIVLNHKDNIRPSVKYKRFLENPLDWLDTENETSLTGHIERIQKYANSKGFGPLIHIYPVFLLAAIMSSENQYANDTDLLWNSSNIDAFIASLKNWITQYGTVKRSQTLIDEAIHTFNASRDKIGVAKKDLNLEIEKLQGRKDKQIRLLKKTEKIVISESREVLRECFDRLAKKEAYAFAEVAYDKGDASSKMWKSFIKRIKFEKAVKDELHQVLDIYLQKAKETTSDLFEDVYFSIRSTFNTEDIKVPLNLDFRSSTRIAGGVIGIAGAIAIFALEATNPIGWILSSVGLLLELGSSLFMTKDQKRQKEIDKIYHSIRNEIEKNADEEIEKTLKSISSGLRKKTNDIEKMFDSLIDGMQTAMSYSQRLEVGYSDEITRLNKLYALRLLQFAWKDTSDAEISNNVVLKVDREQPGIMTITVPTNVPELNTEKLKNVIAENVEIERRDVA